MSEYLKLLPAHRRLEIDAAALLVNRALAFADWAAGEGICPEMSYYKPDIRQEKNPDEFLSAYSDETLDDEWGTLGNRIAEAFRSLEDENGKLKCEINHLSWEVDNAKRERDKAEALTILLLGALKHCVIDRDEWLNEARVAIAEVERAYR